MYIYACINIYLYVAYTHVVHKTYMSPKSTLYANYIYTLYMFVYICICTYAYSENILICISIYVYISKCILIDIYNSGYRCVI